MTPAETYAQKRTEAVELIRQHAPMRLQEALIELLRPAIALQATRADDAQIPLGASKFGGAPDVPANFVWPIWNDKPLGFLAQINLEEVAPFDVEELLPKSGLLSFFVLFDEEDPILGDVEQFEGWRVRFSSSDNLQRVEPPTDSHWIVPLYTQKVAATPTWTLPSQSDWPDYEWEETEWQDFQWGFLDTMEHQIFGGPTAPQLSPFIFAANARIGREILYWESDEIHLDPNDWHLLLQIDTEADGFFDDIYGMGWFYFMIHKDDLVARDFSKVWFNEQCT